MSKVTLPHDDAFLNDELVQWWYWTGHLKTANGRRFGFELCFFALDAGALKVFEGIEHHLPEPEFLEEISTAQMINAAITDIDQGKFYSRVDYLPGAPKELENGFDLHNLLRDCRATGGNGKDSLKSKVKGFKLALDLEQQKPPVLHYDGERHDYSFGGYTYYYSRELMTGKGTLRVAGVEHEIVESSVWFDRQYGKLLRASLAVGWQWFAIQLDNNTQIMLFAYNVEKEHMGSITTADNKTTPLGANDFNVEILDWWTSPDTGRTYPAKWHCTAPGYDLIVTPQLADQELDELWLIPKYWEGACRVEGSHSGSAYVELTQTPLSPKPKK